MDVDKLTVFLNLVPLRTGGGVQQAIGFIHALPKSDSQHRWVIAIRDGVNALEDACNEQPWPVVRIADSLPSRARFELFGGAAIERQHNVDITYTFFGPQCFGMSSPQVVGCAYSNLLYPEVAFWEHEHRTKKLLRAVVDKYRKWRLVSADLAIFETEDLAIRATTVLGMESKKVGWLKPLPSIVAHTPNPSDELNQKLASLPKGFTILSICGFHPNKNLDVLPKVAADLRERHPGLAVNFLMTLPDTGDWQAFTRLIQRYGVESSFFNLGVIPQTDVAAVFSISDAAYVGSRLESFSNTILESWAMDAVLLLPDLQWARGIANDAAQYFKYRETASLADKIAELCGDRSLVASTVAAGRKQLATYPDANLKLEQIERLLEGIASLSNRRRPDTASGPSR